MSISDEEIEKLRFDLQMQWSDTLEKLIDHYNSTKATRDLEEDAARYRVLRDSLAGRSLTWMPRVTDPLSSFYITYMPEGLDAILDKAIEFYKNQPQTTATRGE